MPIAVWSDSRALIRYPACESYGAGLRIQDCLALRVKDIDFDRHQIVVRRGKGQKDVRTMLPLAVRDRLQVHLEEVKGQSTRWTWQ